jgi:hypothetical protein
LWPISSCVLLLSKDKRTKEEVSSCQKTNASELWQLLGTAKAQRIAGPFICKNISAVTQDRISTPPPFAFEPEYLRQCKS